MRAGAIIWLAGLSVLAPTACGESASSPVAPVATCTDAQKNGDESDVDCGGSCRRCETNGACTKNSDCLTLACGAGARCEAAGTAVELSPLPKDADIIFVQDGTIYVMKRDGSAAVQITKVMRPYEHAAASYDRRFVVANEQQPNPTGDAGGRSRLWLFDLEAGLEHPLLADFATAGNGGVAFGPDGYLYFSAKERNVHASPQTPAEHIANAAANDVYKVRFDGVGLTRLTETTDRGEADVSVSQDGALVSFMCTVITPPNDTTEIRVMRSDGSDVRTVVSAGAMGVDSVHDPEVSPDGTRVVFSRVNAMVPPNFPQNPSANTAHDIWDVALDGTDPRRVTRAGPISIIPHWRGETIVYFEANDADDYIGTSLVSAGTANQAGNRIRMGGSQPRWLPPPAP